MKITYYGHSCFLVENQNHSILFDPYEDYSVPGLKLPNDLSVDQVYCSHEHADHNAVHLIRSTGINPWNQQVIRIPHDHHDGTKRGFSNITILFVNGVKVAHLGDIGRLPTDKEYTLLENVDVLMIPVGGYYTIDSLEANEIIQTIKPSLTILMHYRDHFIGYDVLEDIQNIHISNVHRYHVSTIEVTDELLKQNLIITLDPKQK